MPVGLRQPRLFRPAVAPRVVLLGAVLLAGATLLAPGIGPAAGALGAQNTRAPGARSEEAALPSTLTAAIDRLFAVYASDTTPGYAVAVLRDGRPAFWRGYGMANLDELAPITPATAFNVASLSKQFTAACLALVILDGEVRLEDTAAAYVPALAKYHRAGGPPILVKHLVYMTSGLPDYYTRPRKNGRTWSPYDQFTVDDAIEASLAADTLKFRPGTRWDYSNLNYMLLARIVEKASGMPFADFADRRLFRPLEMTHTQVNADFTAVVPHRALGYNPRTPAAAEARQQGRYVRDGSGRFGWATHPRVSPHYGGSGVITTLEDLARWDRNFYTRQFGGRPFFDLMHRRERFGHPKDNDAFGLVFGRYKGLNTVWYEGGDLGFSSYMVRFPDQRTTVVVLSNMGDGNTTKYARRVADLVLDSAFVLPAPSGSGNTEFVLPGHADAQTVFVAGDFNNWDPWTTRLGRRGDRWMARVQPAPGTYGYKFVVNDTTWVRDPTNPRQGGDPRDPHSVLEVRGRR
jgi:CubicO group peptidase (beta-lactamase class C family)